MYVIAKKNSNIYSLRLRTFLGFFKANHMSHVTKFLLIFRNNTHEQTFNLKLIVRIEIKYHCRRILVYKVLFKVNGADLIKYWWSLQRFQQSVGRRMCQALRSGVSKSPLLLQYWCPLVSKKGTRNPLRRETFHGWEASSYQHESSEI